MRHLMPLLAHSRTRCKTHDGLPFRHVGHDDSPHSYGGSIPDLRVVKQSTTGSEPDAGAGDHTSRKDALGGKDAMRSDLTVVGDMAQAINLGAAFDNRVA